jgi:CheY-like chemotaxis protein
LLIREVLERAGYTVLDAADGEQALGLCARHPEKIDMLLTDLVMPRMNGRELAERATALRPELRVLYASGYPSGAVAHRGCLQDDSTYLQKPFTSGVLARKVREVLRA